MNLEVTRDLLNRVKYHRGSALRGPELHNLLPKVTDKFAKHGALLFPKQQRAPFEHPKVAEWKEHVEYWKNPKKKRRRNKTPIPEEPDQFEPTKVSLPPTGKEKLHKLDSTIISKPD